MIIALARIDFNDQFLIFGFTAWMKILVLVQNFGGDGDLNDHFRQILFLIWITGS